MYNVFVHHTHPQGIMFIMKPQNATCFQKIKNLMLICTKFSDIKIYIKKNIFTLCSAL